MRNAIRQRLLDTIPGLNDVYEPHAAGPESKMPFAIVMQGEDTEQSDWVGFRRVVEVWPYVSRSSFRKVDQLVDQVTAALDKQILQTSTGEVFSCMYLGTVGPDFVDKEWNGISRGLRFAVIAVQPVAVPETVSDDPWLDALSLWTQTILDQEWDVYRGKWLLGYRRPSVLWRLTSVEASGMSMAMFEVRKRFVGHVLGRTPNEQTQGALTIVEQLANSIKIPLNLADRRYMTVRDSNVDLQADALNGGQVKVILSRKTNRPTEEGPIMRQVFTRGKLQ